MEAPVLEEEMKAARDRVRRGGGGTTIGGAQVQLQHQVHCRVRSTSSTDLLRR